MECISKDIPHTDNTSWLSTALHHANTEVWKYLKDVMVFFNLVQRRDEIVQIEFLTFLSF